MKIQELIGKTSLFLKPCHSILGQCYPHGYMYGINNRSAWNCQKTCEKCTSPMEINSSK
jgi:hypothetical protein